MTAPGKEHFKRIAALGGRSRIRLYGNPGTESGRKLGGMKSVLANKALKTGFKTLRPIKRPRPSKKLAEALGIVMGDGHVGEYQLSVVTSSETDFAHAMHTQGLLASLFDVPVTLRIRKDKKACVVLVSSKNVCDYFESLGMPKGNKIHAGMRIPPWIRRNDTYRTAFVRGLIDTDGTVYTDKHLIRGREYGSTCIAFTSASRELVTFVKEYLLEAGYNATIWGRNVRLRRKSDVIRYAREVGFNNPKHSAKITIQ
ncbi:MAG TPA: LAGLIDADG family homing endonuclease [Candidatus Paceibacterota bacterium]|nr:LAGLIDADG family homing endonuclease [Candidatus Paceibacterota bacterium]